MPRVERLVIYRRVNITVVITVQALELQYVTRRHDDHVPDTIHYAVHGFLDTKVLVTAPIVCDIFKPIWHVDVLHSFALDQVQIEAVILLGEGLPERFCEEVDIRTVDYLCFSGGTGEGRAIVVFGHAPNTTLTRRERVANFKTKNSLALVLVDDD